MGQQNLLREILKGRQPHVSPGAADVVHELQEGPVIVNVPNQIRQKNQKRDDSAKPEPLIQKHAPLFS